MDQLAELSSIDRETSVQSAPSPQHYRGSQRLELFRLPYVGLVSLSGLKVAATRTLAACGLIAFLSAAQHFISSQPSASSGVEISASQVKPPSQPQLQTQSPETVSNQIKTYQQFEDMLLQNLDPEDRGAFKWEVFLKHSHYRFQEVTNREKLERILSPDRVKYAKAAVAKYIPKDHPVSWDIWEKMVLAITYIETRQGKSNEVSSAGAVGIGQFMLSDDTIKLAKEAQLLPQTFLDDNSYSNLKIKLQDDKFSINLLTFYLRKLEINYQDLLFAVTAYNAGIGTVNAQILEPGVSVLAKTMDQKAATKMLADFNRAFNSEDRPELPKFIKRYRLNPTQLVRLLKNQGAFVSSEAEVYNRFFLAAMQLMEEHADAIKKPIQPIAQTKA